MDFLHNAASYLSTHLVVLFIGVAVLLGAANELINRMKWTAAESILQGGARAALLIPGVRIIPVLGQVLSWCAKEDKSAPPPSGPSSILVLIVATSVLLAGCWKAVLRESVIELERGHAEVTAKAQDYDKRKVEDFKQRYATAKTPAEVETVRAEQKAYEAARAKFADVMNKIWAVILQIKATLPLIERGTDSAARTKITAWIAEGMGWLLQGKDTLSAFGVSIGGVQ